MATAQIVTKSLGYLNNVLPQGFEHIEPFSKYNKYLWIQVIYKLNRSPAFGGTPQNVQSTEGGKELLEGD